MKTRPSTRPNDTLCSYFPNVVRFIKPRMREMTKRQELDALNRPTYTRDNTGFSIFACGACVLNGDFELEISLNTRALLHTSLVSTVRNNRGGRNEYLHGSLG